MTEGVDEVNANLEIPSPDELYDRARKLLPVLIEREEATAELRRLPDETIQDLKDLGFFKILQPKSWGGYEMDPRVYYRVVGILGEASMTTAWVFSVVGVHNWQIALFDEQAQKDVWKDDNSVLISSSYAPMAKVTPKEDGYLISGQWDWSSGCDHCNWVFLGAVVDPEAEGLGGFATVLIPREDYEIVDNWYVYGLKGTGSKRIVVKEAFVPEYRIHKLMDAHSTNSPGNKVNKGPLYKLPFGQVFTYSVTIPALGAYKGAFETWLKYGKTRVSSFGVEAKTDPSTQKLAAETSTEIDEMWNSINNNFERMMNSVTNNENLEINDRVQYRYQASAIVDRCVQGTARLVKASGGASVYLGHMVMQKYIDIMTTQVHVANISEPFAINYGGTLLGLDNTDFNI
tara:strand:+ start:384 stop:1589 length:1206 start_codon:yes stop_codon:yes gene_type:complete